MTKTNNVIQLVRDGQPVSGQNAKTYFNQRPPISPEFIIGSWKGLPVLTGNGSLKKLLSHNWAGKDFHDLDNVDPMVCFNEKGERFARQDWGTARVREVKYNGVVSAAMVYNKMPTIDYFRYVDEQTVIGVMESLDYVEVGDDLLYFVLERNN